MTTQFFHRLVEHLHVRLVPDGAKIARLFRAEQIARAANLEIEICQPETRTEFAQVLDRFESFLGVAGERADLGRDE